METINVNTSASQQKNICLNKITTKLFQTENLKVQVENVDVPRKVLKEFNFFNSSETREKTEQTMPPVSPLFPTPGPLVLSKHNSKKSYKSLFEASFGSPKLSPKTKWTELDLGKKSDQEKLLLPNKDFQLQEQLFGDEPTALRSQTGSGNSQRRKSFYEKLNQIHQRHSQLPKDFIMEERLAQEQRERLKKREEEASNNEIIAKLMLNQERLMKAMKQRGVQGFMIMPSGQANHHEYKNKIFKVDQVPFLNQKLVTQAKKLRRSRKRPKRKNPFHTHKRLMKEDFEQLIYLKKNKRQTLSTRRTNKFISSEDEFNGTSAEKCLTCGYSLDLYSGNKKGCDFGHKSKHLCEKYLKGNACSPIYTEESSLFESPGKAEVSLLRKRAPNSIK